MRARRLLAAALLLAATTGCATKRDLQQLQLSMDAQRVHQDSAFRVLMSRTGALLDSMSRQNVSMRGDLSTRLLAIERQLVQIQELSGQNQAQLSQLRRQIEERAAEARTTAQSGSAAPVGDPNELYEAATQALRRGSVAAARHGFEEFVQSFPQHRLAADAQFAIGQSYDQERNVDGAIGAYGRVVELYPTSGRAPAALLRMGRLEAGRGNRADARNRFDQIVQRYPRSPEVADARTELQRLGGR
jgi:tol-pal system protein YbgF